MTAALFVILVSSNPIYNSPDFSTRPAHRPSNSFQFIALTGSLMSAGAHLILHCRPHSPASTGCNVCWTALSRLAPHSASLDELHDHHH
jgi:hypothetical protein